jgi:hypothetical protein
VYYNTIGCRFAKSGELSGDLCNVCGGFMIFNKTNHKHSKFKNKKTGKYMWTIRCQDCGREVLFESWKDNESAYK